MKQARILSMVTDTFGGYGGIALFNMHFLGALAAHPRCSEVVTVPLVKSGEIGDIPAKVTHVTSAIGGKFHYFASVMRIAMTYGRFDLITCGHIHLLPVAYLAHLVTRAPIVLCMHGIDVWKPPRSVFSRWVTRRLLAYVSVSKLTEKRFRAWAKDIGAKGYVLPNAIRLEDYSPGDKDEAFAARYGVGNRRVLMTLGRLAGVERSKGFDEVIELLPQLLIDAPDLVYLIAGRGFDMARLKAKAEALGVAGHVVFTGYVEEEEKAALYRLADVYVMASRGEGFGFVLLEALATGIPTIASSVDGGREALRDGLLGQLVDPDKPEDLKAAILKALQMPKKVPEGLGYFAYQNFEQRLHGMVDEWLSSARQGGTA